MMKINQHRPITLFLLLITTHLLVKTESILLTARLLTISDEPSIILRTKFKFTEVQLTSKTSALIKNTSITTKDDIPAVPIKTEGRMEKRYHRLNAEVNLYIIPERMDSNQLQRFMEEREKNERKGIKKEYGGAFVMVDSRYKRKEGLRGYGKVCFIDFSRMESDTERDEEQEELSFVEAVNLDCKEVITEVLASLPSKKTVTERNEEEQVPSSTSGWEVIIGMVALLLFTALKLLLFFYKSKRSSVI